MPVLSVFCSESSPLPTYYNGKTKPYEYSSMSEILKQSNKQIEEHTRVVGRVLSSDMLKILSKEFLSILIVLYNSLSLFL